MDLTRIKRLTHKYNLIRMNKGDKPDFQNMTEPELDRHIKLMLEDEHRAKNIISFDLALKQLSFELDNNLISKEEYQLFIDAEKNYWSVI